jgi:hypothetical protein
MAKATDDVDLAKVFLFDLDGYGPLAAIPPRWPEGGPLAGVGFRRGPAGLRATRPGGRG